MSKTEILNKLDDILDNARVNELLGRKKEEEKKCCDKLLWVFAIVGAVVAIAAIAYAMYRYFKPDYLEDFDEDFDDDFEDDFDDDFFEDEEDDEVDAGEEKK